MSLSQFGVSVVGSAFNACPHQPKQTYWIEIELFTSDGKPVPGASYLIVLPNGAEARGTLSGEGFQRIDGIPSAGNCTVMFPEYDKDLWHYSETLEAKSADDVEVR